MLNNRYGIRKVREGGGCAVMGSCVRWRVVTGFLRGFLLQGLQLQRVLNIQAFPSLAGLLRCSRGDDCRLLGEAPRVLAELLGQALRGLTGRRSQTFGLLLRCLEVLQEEIHRPGE